MLNVQKLFVLNYGMFSFNIIFIKHTTNLTNLTNITNIATTFPIQLLIVSFVDPFVQKLKIAKINLVKSVRPSVLCLHTKGDGFCVCILDFY
jgi:hypothetical protein